MAANRAYVGAPQVPPAQAGQPAPGPFFFPVSYIVIDSDNNVVSTNENSPLVVYVSYSDNNMPQLITNAIQAHENDSSLQVIFL